MMRRIKIVMDHEHKIEPDYKHNWVVEAENNMIDFSIDFMSDSRYNGNQMCEMLVIQP